MSKRILHVVTNRGHSDDLGHATGLWLTELTHAWDVFAAEGHAQDIVSPAGGCAPLESEADTWVELLREMLTRLNPIPTDSGLR